MKIQKILILEDDKDYGLSLKGLFVKTLGCYCDVYDNIADGYKAACSGNYDIIILDLIFKKEKVIAHHFIWKLRSLGVKIPIIIISALWAVESKLKSFGFGADEYITKPYIPREVIARVVAVIRRFNGFASSVCKIGPFSIHLDNREVYCKDQKGGKEIPVVLTGKEYSILEILATKNGIVPKETLLNYLYGGLDEIPETKIIDVFVCKLRKKLIEASGGIDLIQTVWGRGYQLNRNINEENDSNSSSDQNNSMGNIENFIKNNNKNHIDFHSADKYMDDSVLNFNNIDTYNQNDDQVDNNMEFLKNFNNTDQFGANNHRDKDDFNNLFFDNNKNFNNEEIFNESDT